MVRSKGRMRIAVQEHARADEMQHLVPEVVVRRVMVVLLPQHDLGIERLHGRRHQASGHLSQQAYSHTCLHSRILLRSQPPSVALHLTRRPDDGALEHRVVRIRKVHAAQAPARPDPAQGHALGAQVVLQQPVVAARLLEQHGPDRPERHDPNRQFAIRQRTVRRQHPLRAPLVHLLVARVGRRPRSPS